MNNIHAIFPKESGLYICFKDTKKAMEVIKKEYSKKEDESFGLSEPIIKKINIKSACTRLPINIEIESIFFEMETEDGLEMAEAIVEQIINKDNDVETVVFFDPEILISHLFKTLEIAVKDNI